MKFGKYLQENQIEQWKEYYIHYKAIKKFIAMADFQNGISNQDEKYFIDKVEENVRRIEEWFLMVRNKCFERFEFVQNDLPKEIKSHLPCISEFTSFQQYTTRTQNKSKKNTNKPANHKKKSKKSKRKHHHKKSRGHDADDDDEDTITKASGSNLSKSSKSSHKKSRSKSSKKSQERLTDSIITSSTSTQSSTKGITIKSITDEDINMKDRVHLIDMSHNDSQQYGDVDRSESESEDEDEDEDEDDESLSDGEEDDNKYEEDGYSAGGMGMDDSSSFNEKYLRKNIDGDLISPPTTLFIENAVFSHLPPSAHRECLSILLTLGKLKLFAWQNSEGVRKIIKKYDKRFSKTLTSTLWPKIKLNEFVQETKNESYIAQVAAVLCTRTIPFGHLDANDLREKGVNLKQMAECIQQLEAVTECTDLKEIIPMNVEPRSYMANERTFLKWMRMAALTVLVGMIILSMGHEKVTGVLLIILSIGVLLRSYHEYYKRNEVLVNRIQYEWVDNLGPILLLLSLMLPMTTYLVYLILFGSTNNMFHK